MSTKQAVKIGTTALLALLLAAPATGLADKAPPQRDKPSEKKDKEAGKKDAGKDAGKKDAAKKDAPPPAAGW
jgi:hypothetical protein